MGCDVIQYETLDHDVLTVKARGPHSKPLLGDIQRSKTALEALQQDFQESIAKTNVCSPVLSVQIFMMTGCSLTIRRSERK